MRHQLFGFPLAPTPRNLSLAAPSGTLTIELEEDEAAGTHQFNVALVLNSVVSGAALRVWALDETGQAVIDINGRPWARTISPTVGVQTVGRLPDGEGMRHLCMAWIDSEGGFGHVGSFQRMMQTSEEEPAPALVYTTPPSLVVGTSGALSGSTVNASSGAFTADSDDTAELTLWITDDFAPPDPGVETHGSQITPFTFGTTTPMVGHVGKFLWVRGAITDGVDTIYAWSVTPVQVFAPAVSGITLVAADVEVAAVIPVTGDLAGLGLHVAVLYINPTKVSPSNTDIRIRAAWTGLSQPDDVALANWHPIIGGDEDGYSPKLPEPYTRANGYWRVDRREDQEGLGTTWVYPWALREGRQADNTDPRRYLRNWHISNNGGSTFNHSTFSVLPSIPVAPPTPAPPAYWKSVERSQSSGNNYGFGYQYCRGIAFCEDEPNFGMAVGDMNYIRLSETMGATWYHAEGSGLRIAGGNSGYVDPRDHNHLLAVGNFAWWNDRTGAYDYTSLTGIWRSTNFGRTWALAHQMMNSSALGYGASCFCYDPATRAGAVSQRRVFLANITKKLSAAATGFTLLRSDNGGATWATHLSLPATASMGQSAATFGNIFALRHHPTDGTLLMATQTGLWRSNLAKTAWSRIAGGLPANRCQSIEIMADGVTMYAAIRPLSTANDAAQNGVWKSTNNGASWTRVFSEFLVARVAVNHADNRVYVQRDGATQPQIMRSGNGGSTWQANGSVVNLPGWPTGDHVALANNPAGGRAGHAYGSIVCPRANGAVLSHASSRMFLSTDGGNVYTCAIGFTGTNAAATGSQMCAQDPNNPERWCFGVQDFHLMLTTNNGQSYVGRQVPNSAELQAALGLSVWPSVWWAAWLRSGRILLGFGSSWSRGVIRTDNLGTSYVALPAMTYGYGAWEHPSVNNAIVTGNSFSRDGGNTQAGSLGGRFCVGIDASGRIYAMSDNLNVWRSTNGNWATSGSPTFQPFYTGPSMNKFGIHGPVLRVSEAEDGTIWTKGAGKQLIRVRNAGTTAATAEVATFSAASVPGIGLAAHFDIGDLHPDPNDPRVCYITTEVGGADAMILRLVIDTQHATSPTFHWENVTLGAPRWMGNGIYVLRHNSDVLLTGGVGAFAYPRRAGSTAPAASHWGTLATPVKVPVVA